MHIFKGLYLRQVGCLLSTDVTKIKYCLIVESLVLVIQLMICYWQKSNR